MPQIIFLPHAVFCPDGLVVEVEPGVSVLEVAHGNHIDIEIAVNVPRRNGVEIADHGRDIRLEEAVPQAQQHQTGVEGRQAADSEGEVTCRHQEATNKHRSPKSEIPVGDHATKERREVNECQVGAVDLAGGRVRG